MVLLWHRVLVLPAIVFSSVNAQSVMFVDKDDPQAQMPLGPKSYPKALQGMLWMDQHGVISNSGVNPLTAAPDAGLTFGDPVNKLDREGKQIYVDTSGPGWQWLNSALGYKAFEIIRAGSIPGGDRCYRFAFNEDYTFAQIYLSYYGWEIPKFIVSFTMTLQTPPKGKCPPKPDASKEEFQQCAVWKRESYSYGFISLGDYYVFEVMDADGNPVQPYYDKFVEYSKSHASPACKKAIESGFSVKGDVSCKDADVFVGKKSSKPYHMSLFVWCIVTLFLLIIQVSTLIAIGVFAYLQYQKCKEKAEAKEQQSVQQTLLPQ